MRITILLSEMAKAKIDQNYKFHFVKWWKTYSTIWKYCLKDFIWTPKDFIHTQKLETPYVRDSLIHSLEVKGLVYRHLGLVNVLYMFFL